MCYYSLWCAVPLLLVVGGQVQEAGNVSRKRDVARLQSCNIPLRVRYLWKRDARNLKDYHVRQSSNVKLIRCAEDKGNRKAAAIFGVDESNVRLWRKHKAAFSGCEASRKKFTGPKKGRFPQIYDAVFKFFRERRKTGLFVSYDLLRKEIFEHSSKSF